MPPTYATEADLAAYVAGTAYEGRIPADAPARDRLLELAERDLDQQAFLALEADAATGRKILLGDLDVQEKAGLSAAACAQAVYRVEMGDEHFTRAQRERVTGRAFAAEGKLPILGPQASRELAAAGLFARTTTLGRRRYGEAERFQSS